MINEKLRDKEFFEEVKAFYSAHTAWQTVEEFGITKKQLAKLLKFFNYRKPKELYIRTKTPTHEEYVQRGIKSSHTQKANWENKSEEEKKNWADRCRDVQLALPYEVKTEKVRKAKSTMQSKPKEELDRINADRKCSCKKFWESLSHTDRNSKIENQLSRTKGTCMELYGVPYPCMREEARMHGSDSAPNREFATMLQKNGIEFYREFRIDNFQYDFKVGNTLIEINPTITHNATFNPYGRSPVSKSYHRDKMILAKKNGYRILCVWDWDDTDKVIKLLKNRCTIYARNCIVSTIDACTCSQFINKNHIQGYSKDKHRLGLFYNNELVSVMTFGKPRYNKTCDYELIRYCSTHNVIGGAEKLFSFFIHAFCPQSIVSYCDESKFLGGVYTKLGFSIVRESIGKHWFNIRTKEHILDSVLRANGFDRLLGEKYGFFGKGTNNAELMLQHGFVEVYDCGQATYMWKCR